MQLSVFENFAAFYFRRYRSPARLITINAFLAAVLLGGGCASMPPEPSAIKPGDYRAVTEYLSHWIPALMRARQVQGLSIALVDDQRVVWAQGFGFADTAAKKPATPETIYRIGSVSKVITAAAILKLADEGRLDLGRPLTLTLPSFSIRCRFPGAEPITTRALLAHHGGLPSDRLCGMWGEHPATLEQTVADLSEDSLASPPETLYKYSNLGYDVLGREIEVICRKPFADALHDLVLKPLGMDHSAFAPTPALTSEMSRAYRQGKEMPSPNLRDAPAGAMVSTVLDLSRLMSGLFAEGSVGGRVWLKPQSVRSMFMPQYRSLAFDFGHQLSTAFMLTGLDVAAGERVAWHNGAAVPFQAQVSLLPEKKLGVVILSNSDEAQVTQIGVKALQLAREAKTGSPSRSDAAPGLSQANLSAEDLDKFAGTYVVFAQAAPIVRNGGLLKVKLWDHDFDLAPIGPDRFRIQAPLLWGLFAFPLPGLSVQFLTIEGKDLASLQGLPGPFPFEKVKPAPVPAAWQARGGDYECVTPDEEFTFQRMTLEAGPGALAVNVVMLSKSWGSQPTPARMALAPVSDTDAVFIGLGNGEGGTLRAVQTAKGEELQYSGFRFIKK